MCAAQEQNDNDQLLTRYLLGELTADEQDRLDDLSITDDEFALRLRSAENELVDAYARGELSGEIVHCFRTVYLSSPERRQKLRFAQALSDLKVFTPDVLVTAEQDISSLGLATASRWGVFSTPRRSFQRGFACAAAVLLLAASYLVLRNSNLQKQLTAAEQQNTSLDNRMHELQMQLEEQRAANAKALDTQSQTVQQKSTAKLLSSFAVLLLPQTRGVTQPVTLAIVSGAELLALRLSLESNEFPQYSAALRNPATNLLLWRSSPLEIQTGAKGKSVLLTLPAQILKEQNYALELYGIPANASPEFVSTYSFHVVFR